MRQIQCTPQGEIPFGTLSLQGDQALAGFEELAMPLSHSLYNFAHWLAHNQHDAEDLVQETYLRAFRSFASFEPGTNFRAWIFRILRNSSLTLRTSAHYRRRASMLHSDEHLDDLSAYTPDPIEILMDQARLNAIE